MTVVPPEKCGDSEFTCGPGECVPLEKVCNGKWDCGYGNDEASKICQNGRC